MRFFALDGWRGASALLVALYHLPVLGHFYGLPVVRNATLFVDFFFVLSGFVISHAYMARLGRVGDATRFVIRRFGRLWPLHVAVLVAFIALLLIKLVLVEFAGLPAGKGLFVGQHSVDSILPNVLLIHALGFYDPSWNVPSWSISTEFWTYLAFAALCLFAAGRLVPLSVLIAAAAVIVLSSSGYFDPHYAFPRCLYGFFVGHLVYRVWASDALARLPVPGALELLAVVLVVGFVSAADRETMPFLAPLAFAFVVYVFAFEGGAVSRIMRTVPFERLGTWSYSIYMVHALVAISIGEVADLIETVTGLPTRTAVAGATQPLVFIAGEYAMDLVALVYIAVVIGCARLTHRHVEEPGRRFFNRLSHRAARRAVALATRRRGSAPSTR